jgi:signal peptidase I
VGTGKRVGLGASAVVGEQVEEKETMLESIAGICVVIAIWVFATTFIAQNFVIPSGSMEKTLLIGDHVVVDRLTFAPPTRWMPLVHYRAPTRGDIIVFLKPHPEEPDLILVKRLVGVGGDRIHLRHGVLYLNGVAQNEPYAAMPVDDGNPNHAYVSSRDDFPQDLEGIQEESAANNAPGWAAELPSHIQGDDIVVPPGMVFAMGDNRLGSLDSRFWGFVPRENILGRPLVVFWSFKMGADQMEKTSVGDKVAYMAHVVTHIFDGTRWSRTLHVVR